MIILLAILTCFILITAITRFLVKDFARFIIRRTILWKFPNCFVDLGEYFTTWFFILLIAIAGFLFYKFASVLAAYALSDDLIQFFLILRNVFTVKSESQNPFLIQNTLSGLVLSPLIQFISCYVIYRSLRSFMFFINRRYNSYVYSESDLLFFSFFGVLMFIFVDILSYSQHIPVVSAFAHFVYLAVSRLACICYILTIAHVTLLASSQYKESMPLYFKLHRHEESIILSPWKSILLTYSIGIILNVPMFLGTQFLDNNMYVLIICLLSCFVFYIILRVFLKKGYNYLGAVLFHHRLNVENILVQKNFNQPWIKRTLSISLSVTFIFWGIVYPKIFFFIFVILLLSFIIILFFNCIGYFTFLGASVVRARKTGADVPSVFIPGMKYIKSTYLAFCVSVVPSLLFILFVTVLMSLSPKKYPDNTDNDFVTSVSGKDGYPLHIKYNDGNSAIPVAYSELPAFLTKCVLLQEDRGFLDQNSWLPNLSNWHGISLASLYRSFIGNGGGSNINMQLIKNIAFSGSFPADIQRKFSESIAAFQLSFQLTPEQIATQYFNQVAWNGGKTHSGINMGSLYTFGIPVRHLNELQMLFLVKTLRRGSFFKVQDSLVNYKDAGIFSREIKKELLKYATTMYKNGAFTKKEYNKLKTQDLGFINTRYNSLCQASTKDFFNKLMDKKNAEYFSYQSSITFKNQQAISLAVNEFNERFREFVESGQNSLFTSAIVVDIQAGKILAHYGSNNITDITTMGTGRNMGSIIKPFVFCELLENGFNANSIRLYDGPVKGLKTPKDFGKYSYKYLSIDEALAQSRNASAVNIRLLTDPISLYKGVETRFRQMGIPSDPYLNLDNEQLRTVNILNYPLGSRNMTLFNVAQSYQALFNEGRYIQLTPFESYYDPYKDSIIVVKSNSRQIYSPRNANRLKAALHSTMLKGGTTNHLNDILKSKRKMYAKTGTTDEARDGLCVLSDGDILVVSYISYGQINNNNLKLGTAPIPFGAAGRSAGVFCAIIYNHFYNLLK